MKRPGKLERSRRPWKTRRRKGRIVASGPAYAELVARVCFGEACACGCGRKAETAHHLVGRAQGGDDLIDCLVPLAGDGTRLCHGAFTSKQRTYDPNTRTYIDPAEVARGIRRSLETRWPEKLGYVVRKAGRPFLERAYPRTEGAPA